MPTPCIHCQSPLNTPGVCAKCKANQIKLASSKLGGAGAVRYPSTSSSSSTPFKVTCQFPAVSRHPHRASDHQIQITQQLQARSKLTTLQPKPVRLATTPRVLNRNSKLRFNQGAAGNSSASQVSQQLQHQIRHRYRAQCPRQNTIPLPGTSTKYRLVSRSDLGHRSTDSQGSEQLSPAPSDVTIKGASLGSPIRIITSTSNAHISSPIETVVHAANSAVNGRVTHLVRTVNPVAGHSVVSSQQLVRVAEPTLSAVVSPTTPSASSQYRVTLSNGPSSPLFKILYPVPPRPAIAGLSSSQLTPLTVSNNQVVSRVLVTPSGTFQVFRHATNPSAQNHNNIKHVTHQSLSIMGPAQGRLLRSKSLPPVPKRSEIEPPSVVTIDDEDVCLDQAKEEGSERSETEQDMIDSNYYKLEVVEPPKGIVKGKFRLRAQRIQIGTFLLRDRFVTFSRLHLQIHVRPVDSLTEEVELNFYFSDILKAVYALTAETPAIIFNFTPECGERIRKALHMQYHEAVEARLCDDAQYPYFEPKSLIERQKRVVIVLGEPLSDKEYGLIQDCYMSPKGVVKREFAEKLLSSTEPNVNTHETPVWSDGGIQASTDTSGNEKQPGTSLGLRTGAKRIRLDSNSTRKIVTSNGIVTVTYPSGTQGVQTTTMLSPGGVHVPDDLPLCQYPPSGKGLIVIRAPDLLTLLPDKSLNDTVIDFFLSYIIGELLPEERAEKVFAFNTFFYSSLVKDPLKTANTGISEARRQHDNVKRWTKGVDLFAKDFILIPVCEHSHWFLIIVCYPWLVPKKHGIDLDRLNTEHGDRSLAEPPTKDSPDSSCQVIEAVQNTPTRGLASSTLQTTPKKSDIRGAIYVFDSLRGTVSAPKIYSLIRNYLAEEFLAKKGVPCNFDYWSMRGYSPNGPQQTNNHDCGIFLLEYARKFLLNPPPPDGLGQSNMFIKMFDQELIMEKGRWEVAEVVFKLSEEQFPELKGAPRLKYEKLIKVEGKPVSEETKTPHKRTRQGNTPK